MNTIQNFPPTDTKYGLFPLTDMQVGFARGRIEDSSFNRFALNGIPELPATLCFFGGENTGGEKTGGEKT